MLGGCHASVSLEVGWTFCGIQPAGLRGLSEQEAPTYVRSATGGRQDQLVVLGA